MAGIVELDMDQGIIRVRFGEDSTVDEWSQALEEVTRLSEETGVCRLLIDVRRQTRLAPPGTLFQFGAELPGKLAYAVLVEMLPEDHRFIEDVATNRGIRLKDFEKEEAALAWLNQWPNAPGGTCGE